MARSSRVPLVSKYPRLSLTPEIIKASRCDPDAFLRKEQRKTQAELDRLKRLLDESSLFDG